ncbi:hypothetical protein HN51_054579 [Arachis hypogaea]|uniref:Root-knot resistance protein n=2 Tax=Arachis hypogaea TaxID=3818 RepID=A0A6B9V813_ARAHY|nr:titin [Arachis ipaensis]XP_020967111.1 titin [Arachis ipaensis]XP_025677237.1 titin [Arachis hypogaea]XP_025677238.1 titin [Arachis hypogaea]QHN77165.1 Putative root-knot resistance protein [Arachis hypogaea]
MATEAAASDHTSVIADEQIVKKEKNEAIAEMIASLVNEDGDDKTGKTDDAQGEEASPPSKTEVEAEAIDKSIDLEEEKPNDSPADAKRHEVPSGEEDEKKDDSALQDVNSTNKELIPESVTIIPELEETPPTEPVVKIEKEQEKQPEKIDVQEDSANEVKESEISATQVQETPKKLEEESLPEASTETIEKSEVAKESKVLEQSVEKEEKPEAELVATQLDKTEAEEETTQEEPAEPEQEQEVVKEKQILEPSTEKEEKSEAELVATQLDKPEPEEETTREEPAEPAQEQEVVKEKQILEPSAEKEEKLEPVTTKEESQDAENPSTVEEEEQPREVSEEEVLKDKNSDEAESAETEKTEPLVTEVEEAPKEPEKQSSEIEEEEQANAAAVPEHSAETVEETNNSEKEEKQVNADAVPEPEVETLEETNNAEEGSAETEKAERLPTGKVDENPIKPEKQEEKSQTVIAETVDEVHSPEKTATVIPEESLKLETAAVPEKADEVEEKPRELSQVEETETKQEVLAENTKKEDKTSVTATSNAGETYHEEEVAEKVVEEDCSKKETSVADEAQNEVAQDVKLVEQVSSDIIDEEKENHAPVTASIAEKVEDVAAKEQEPEEALIAVPREAEIEINKPEEPTDAKASTTPETECIEDKKEVKAESKVDEISAAVKEPVRETLASKFEQQEEESAKKEEEIESKETTSREVPKEAPAKPVQKQSNNIISKVKQSLVKAKKAITGKSPSSKNLNSDAKGDIKVK